MISVIVPVFDEAGTLEQLHRELTELATSRGCEMQIVMVDDGSSDGSWAVIEELAERDPRVLGVRFRRNFGKAAALSAGFDCAAGDVIVTMDADLQDSPAEIPKLLAKLDEGVDVVSGWKVDRHDPWHKRWPSKVFNFLVGWLTGVKLHDHNCGLKAFRRDVIHEIRLYGELHRFVPVLAAARGFRIGEAPVEHRPRVYGRSKYGWSRIPKGLLDLLTVKFITRYGQRPQHWLGMVGLVALMIGMFGMTYLAAEWCWTRRPGQPPEAAVHLHETAALYYSLTLLLFGTNLLALGFVAEMIASLVSRDRDEFSVAQYTTPQDPRAREQQLAGPGAAHAGRPMNGGDDATRLLRRGVYAVLIALAAGNMAGRLLAVNSVNRAELEQHLVSQRVAALQRKLKADGADAVTIETEVAKARPQIEADERRQRPFLGANDRSRWLTIRSLVDHGTFEIDEVMDANVWNTIDMVQHRGRDGELHQYSSKPPLLSVLLAGEYWLVRAVTGWTLAEHPYEVGRLMLLITNVLPMLLLLAMVAWWAERFGTTDWGRVFVVASASLGTLLTPFAVVLNNHIPAAVCAAIAADAFVRIWFDGERRARWFAAAGAFGALTVADDLPALSFLALLSTALMARDWRPWLAGFVPAAGIVVAAFFVTNYVAHDSWRPAYMHRSETDPADNWYAYKYMLGGKERSSYWLDPQGIDRGEDSKLTYAVHVLVGHHGIFSLTPVWLLSVWGACVWMGGTDSRLRQVAAGVALLTIVCLVFYIGLRPKVDRNYGGMTAGFRWLFWMAPLWLITMIPAADRASRSRFGMAVALVLLAFSTLSASYPTWNPWTQPWIYNWLAS